MTKDKRLIRTFPACVRSMQISQISLFIYIEGKKDRYIYSKLVDLETTGKNLKYRIITGEEILGKSGGKTTLLEFHDYLKSKSSLVKKFRNKYTASMFFFDKDIDDFRNTIVKSDHIIYTKTYELENYLFIYGDIIEAAAASAGLDVASMRHGIGNQITWLRNSAEKWKVWVRICFFSKMYSIDSIANYRCMESPIHVGATRCINPILCKNHILKLKTKSRLSPVAFIQAVKTANCKVNQIYYAGNHDLIFKGKWYVPFLVADIKTISKGRQYQKQSIEQTLLSNLARSMDFKQTWANHFRLPVRNIITKMSV